MFAFIRALYYRLTLDHGWIVLLLMVALLAAAATQVRHFHLDASAESLMLAGDEDMHYYRKVRAQYGSDDFLIVTFTPEAALFSDESLEQLKVLRDELVNVESVASAMTILDVPLLQSPPVTFDEVQSDIRTLSDPDTDRDLARQEFLESPLYRDLLMNRDADTTALLLTLEQDEELYALLQRRDALRIQEVESGLNAEEVAELASVEADYRQASRAHQAELESTIADVRRILDAHRNGSRIHLGGVPMIAVDMIEFVRNDIATFGVGVALFIILLLAFTFRRLRWVLLPVGVSGGVALGMTGFLGFMDWPVTVVSSNFISLVLIITLSLMIHLIVRHRELHQAHPEADGRWLMAETIESKFKPSLYTALTTMIAFGAMVFADIRPVMDFGLMMVCAVAFAFVLTFAVFPAGLARLKPGPLPTLSRDYTARFNARVAELVSGRELRVMGVFLLIAMIAAVGITRITVENRFIDYFKSDTEIHQGMALIDQELGGTTPLDVVLDPSQAYLDDGDWGAEQLAEEAGDDASEAGEPASTEERDEATSEDDDWDDDEWGDDDWGDDDWGNGELDRDGPVGGYWFNEYQVDVMEDIHNYLESLDETGKVLSVATSLKLMRQLNQGRQLSSFEMGIMFEQLPADLREILFDPYMTDDGDQIRFDIRVIDSDPNLERDALLKKIRSDLMRQFDLGEEQIRLSGMLVLYNNVMQSLVRSQWVTLLVVFSAMMLMFAFLFRSLKMAFIGPLPTLVASISVMGLIGWVGLPLDLMTMTIAAITIGIGVHDTIHYTHRFQSEVADSGSYAQALRESHRQVGRAMVYTSVIIIAGFSILTLSNFMPTIYFGLLTGVAMTFALLSNLFLLPALLGQFRPFSTGNGN
ncbi:putative RND superfamily exporter protein [Natronospira proteinivora]|uniref:RND superfamily exporter protein n=1 Tax=Natronospira proteinivora TaxID=1807133 RepID=A0ABT1G931_9GAMM|nr:MMPL family transporter [Natronospira proteinivora]MCP1727829.1 putative RND superfamily exporter protein [Natronospira proteinivora]